MKFQRIASLLIALLMIFSLNAVPIACAQEETTGTDETTTEETTQDATADTGTTEETTENTTDVTQTESAFSVDAKAALLVDRDTGLILYEQNAYERLPQASITKIMTALLVLEAIDRGELSLDEMVTCSATALAQLDADSSTANIVAGESMSVENLLYCLLVVSANEVSNIFAERLSGSISAFVDLMNQRAAELGCEDTHFVTTNGLHDPNHYTTAWDIYLQAKECMKHDLFMTICNTKSYTVPATNMSGERELHSTNALISNWRTRGYLYDGAEGIKTGSTDEAGKCLLSSAVRGDRAVISVVLGCTSYYDETQDRNVIGSFAETAKLFDYGFDNFSYQTVLSSDEMVAEVPVSLSRETNYVLVHPAGDATLLLPNDATAETVERKIVIYNDGATAPIAAGEKLGEITLSYNGTDYTTIPLLAVNDVSASKLLLAKAAVVEFLSRTVVKIILIVVILLVLLFLYWWFIRRPRRRYGRRSKYRTRSNYRGRSRRSGPRRR